MTNSVWVFAPDILTLTYEGVFLFSDSYFDYFRLENDFYKVSRKNGSVSLAKPTEVLDGSWLDN